MNIFYHQFSRIQQFFTFFSSFCYYSSFRNSVSVRKSFRVNVSQFVNLHNRIGMYIGRQVQYLQMSPLKLGEEGPISERDRFFISISYSKKRIWIMVSVWGFLLALFHNIVEAPEFLHKIPEYICTCSKNYSQIDFEVM